MSPALEVYDRVILPADKLYHNFIKPCLVLKNHVCSLMKVEWTCNSVCKYILMGFIYPKFVLRQSSDYAKMFFPSICGCLCSLLIC